MAPNLKSRFAIALAAVVLALGLISMGGGAEQKQNLSKNELKALIAKAKTPDDHEKIAAYYRAEAQRLRAEQKDHEEEAAEYFRNPSSHPSPKWPTMGQHCRDLAADYGRAAQKALALADMHDQMAKDAK